MLHEELTAVFLGSQPPEQLHGGQFSYEGAWGSNSVLKQASDIAGSAWERLAALHEYRVNRNPEDEPAIHARKLSRLVEDFSRDFGSQWDSVKTGLKAERQRIEAELIKAANLKANPAHFNAIVGSFQGLSAQARSAVIDQAIAEGDGPTLQTLLEAPSMVTGLSVEQRDVIRSHIYMKANPTAYELLLALDKATARAEAASLARINATLKLLEGTDKYDAKVKRAEVLEAKIRVS